MSLGIMFPGQGAPVGNWTEGPRHPCWDAVVGRAEAAVGLPLGELLVGPPPQRTRDAQLAVLLASLLAWEAVRPDVDVKVFAGHSLGQVTALIAAEVLSFEDGVRFAVERAEATQAAADRRPGCMVALLGADDSQVAVACAAAPGACWRANDNAPGQVVIAGVPEGVATAVEAARHAGVRKVMPLAVGGAFHTPMMQEAADSLRPTLARLRFRKGIAPIVSNADAKLHRDPDGWAHRLVNHLVRPVQWRASLETMDRYRVDALVEVGPGAALSAMARRAVPKVPVRAFDASAVAS